jgi:hypothetical protein
VWSFQNGGSGDNNRHFGRMPSPMALHPAGGHRRLTRSLVALVPSSRARFSASSPWTMATLTQIIPQRLPRVVEAGSGSKRLPGSAPQVSAAEFGVRNF